MQIKIITAWANLLSHFPFHTMLLTQNNSDSNTGHKTQSKWHIQWQKQNTEWINYVRDGRDTNCTVICEPPTIFLSFIWNEITAITHASHARLFTHHY
jgi:hypothetical protein